MNQILIESKSSIILIGLVIPLLAVILISQQHTKFTKLGRGLVLSNINIKQISLISLTISLAILSLTLVGVEITRTIDILDYTKIESVLPSTYEPAKGSPYGFEVGVDGLSIFFVLLTALLTPLAYLSNWVSIKDQKSFAVIMLVLDPLLLLIFLVLDVLGFYIFFESILAPLYILIGLYGSANKEKAAYFLLIYTLAGSLIMLIGVGTLYSISGTTKFDELFNVIFSVEIQSFIWITIFASVMVKTPVFPIHTWLPVVHSESPLSGSILLAGVILKLAIFSCIRILLPIFNEGSVLYTPFLYVIAVITIIYTSLATIRQMDVKVVIAYSSIGHMGTCLLGIFANNLAGINGSILLSICHGFVSPALFLCVGGILYDRYHVRISNYFQGLAINMPIFMIFFFIFSLANIATPLSGNFIGEFLSLTGSFMRSPLFGFLGASSVLLTAIYMMKFNSRITGGILPASLHYTFDLRKRETFILSTLLIPVLLLGIVPSYFTNIVSSSAYSLIYSL